MEKTIELKLENTLDDSQGVVLTNEKGDTFTSKSEGLIDFLMGAKDLTQETKQTK